MNTVAIKSARKFEIKKAPEPVSKNGFVVAKVVRAGICGSDIHYWEAGQPVGLVMGHEFCGIVEDAGSRKDLKVGDRITALPISPCGKCEACRSGNPQYCRSTWTDALGLSLSCPGGFAPKLAVRPDMVVKVPKNLTDEEVAMVEPTAVGLHAIHLADIKVGDHVLVVGGGIIGLVSAMFAKAEGASLVVVSETNPARGKLAVKLGVADQWLDAKDPKFLEKAIKKSEGGFDTVIECCGNSAAVQSAIMTTKPGGTVVLAGVSLIPINFPSTVAVMGEMTIKGAIGYTKEEFETCVKLMSQKKIDVRKFVTKTVGLSGVQAAFEDLTSGSSKNIKILIDPEKK